MSNNYTIEELLAKYLAEENSEDDHELLKAMLNETDEADTLLDQSKLIWDTTTAFQHKQTVDVEAAWSKVKTQIHSNETPAPMTFKESDLVVEPLRPVRSKVRLWPLLGSMAAGIALVVGSIFWFSSSSSVEVAMLTAQSTNQKLQKTLPDGTKVWLNKNSRIQFPAQFTGNTREISLTGEAFFDVAHDAAHPFIIHAQQTDVKVLGTSFNVKAYDTKVSVFVKTGKVQFSQKQASVTLIPGQQAQTLGETLQLLDHPDENTIAYQTQKFVFDNTPLNEVVHVLSETYGQKITLENPAMSTCKLTATFEEEKLDNIVQVIVQTFGFKLKMKGKEYVLNGNGCL